jgi:hypothetical protein
VAALADGSPPRRTRELTPNADLQAAWKAAANPKLAALTATPPPRVQDVPEQWLVLVTCRDEERQMDPLEWFRWEGLECKAPLP